MELKSSDFQLLFGSAEKVLNDKILLDAIKLSSSKFEFHLSLSAVVADEVNVIEMWSVKR